MECPICKKNFQKKDKNVCLPFCSERCKEIDLGNWLNEEYTIPAVELDDEEITELEKTILENENN